MEVKDRAMGKINKLERLKISPALKWLENEKKLRICFLFIKDKVTLQRIRMKFH